MIDLRLRPIASMQLFHTVCMSDETVATATADIIITSV